MAKLIITNNAVSRLSANISPTDTSISLLPGGGAKFPALAADEWFPATFIKVDGTLEIMRVIARATDVLTVVRGQEATAAISFNAGDRVEHRFTAGAYAEENSRIEEIARSAADFGDDIRSVAGAGLVGFSDDEDYPETTVGNRLKKLAQSLGSTFIGFIQQEVLSVARKVSDKLKDVKHAKDYGLKLDGVADDSAAAQAMFDMFSENGKKVCIRFNGTAKFNSGIKFNMSLIRICGDNAVFDFSGMSSGDALTVTGSGTGTPYRQSAGGMEGIEAFGPGYGSNVDGVIFDSIVESGSSHSNFRDVNVHSFRTGNIFRNNAYAINFWSCDIWGCTTASLVESSAENAGERISYFGCTIFNNLFAFINDNANASFHIIGSSVDYNGVQAVAKKGRIFFSNSHYEAKNYSSPPFVTYPSNGATIVIQGGWMLCTGTGIDANTSEMFLSQTTPRSGGGIFVKDIFYNNLGSGRWKAGAGRFSLDNATSYDTSDSPKLASLTENRLVDGRFEDATVIDAFIVNDTAAITSRTTGANVKLTLSSAEFQSGSKSLKCEKTFGAGSPCSFMLAVPITRQGALFHFTGSILKPGAETGSIFVSHGFAKIAVVGGIEVPLKSDLTGTTEVVFTSSRLPWTNVKSGEPTVYAPYWATHFFVDMNLSKLNGPGVVHFDDFEIYQY